jgi:hypothetical protein
MPRLNEWFTNLRKTALLNCLFTFLSALIPAKNLAAQFAVTVSVHPEWRVWTILAWVALALLGVLILSFFYALSRDRATLVLPDHLRLIALGAAIILAVIGFRVFGEWAFGIRDDWSFLTDKDWRAGAGSIRSVLEDPVTAREFASSTNTAAVVSYVLFLIALFRQKDDSARSDVPVSKFLAVVTRITLFVAGMIVAFLLFRVFMTPYVYSQLREVAAQVGRNLPPFFYLIRDTVRDLLVGACYFTAPFLVYMSIRHAQRAENRSEDSLMQ